MDRLLKQERRVSLKPFLNPKGTLCWAYALGGFAGDIFLVREVGARFGVKSVDLTK